MALLMQIKQQTTFYCEKKTAYMFVWQPFSLQPQLYVSIHLIQLFKIKLQLILGQRIHNQFQST